MAKLHFRGIELAFIPKNDSEIIVRLCKMRIDPERSPIAGDSFVPATHGAVKFSQIAMHRGIVGVRRERLPHPLHRQVGATDLMGQNSERMQRIGVAWLHREDLSVKSLGFGQATGPVMLRRLIEGLLDGEHRHHGTKS